MVWRDARAIVAPPAAVALRSVGGGLSRARGHEVPARFLKLIIKREMKVPTVRQPLVWSGPLPRTRFAEVASLRRREEVVARRESAWRPRRLLGRERRRDVGDQIEAASVSERHLCTNRPVASMAWMTETRRENLIHALNVTSVSSFSPASPCGPREPVSHASRRSTGCGATSAASATF